MRTRAATWWDAEFDHYDYDCAFDSDVTYSEAGDGGCSICGSSNCYCWVLSARACYDAGVAAYALAGLARLLELVDMRTCDSCGAVGTAQDGGQFLDWIEAKHAWGGRWGCLGCYSPF